MIQVHGLGWTSTEFSGLVCLRRRVKQPCQNLLCISDITVNGQVVGKPPVSSSVPRMRTYFGKIAILSPSINITINPVKIKIQGRAAAGGHPFSRTVHWNSTRLVSGGGACAVNVTGSRSLVVRWSGDLVLTVIRHRVRRNHPFKVDYLGLYVTEGDGLSSHTTGLIGEFVGWSRPGPKLHTCVCVFLQVRQLVLHGETQVVRSS